MQRLVQMVLIGWVAAAGYGQAKPLRNEIWNQGKLELMSGVVLDGQLSYNWKAEIVQLRQPDGKVKAYSAFQVNRFIYFDTQHSTLRTFASVEFPVTPSLERRLFLEEYTTGPLTVYRRLRHQHEPIRAANPAQSGNDELIYDDLDGFVYYVYQDKAVVDLVRFERDLWPAMKEQFGPQLTQYRLSRHLDTSTTLSRLLLIAHYNALKVEGQRLSAQSDVVFGSLQ